MAASDDDVRGWTAAGLYDPESATAAQRRALLEWYASLGISLEQMIAAHERGELGSLAGDLLVRPAARWTLREVAERLDTTTDDLVALRRAGGFAPVDPDEPAYNDLDLVLFGSFREAAAMFSRAELLHFARVLGTSMRRIADAASEMFFVDVEVPLRTGDGGSVELQLAQKNLQAMELMRSAIDAFEPMFRAQLRESIAASRRARRNAESLDTIPIAVGFVDLSGYTSMAEQIDPDELLRAVLDFESAAYDIVAECGGRVVKMIGDEVMFTTIDAEGACDVAAGLVRTITSHDDARPRGGVAFGNVIAHGGDLYGATVNRASRMADTAIPGEVLVDAEVVSRAGSKRFESAGRRQLKGFREPVPLWSLDVSAPARPGIPGA